MIEFSLDGRSGLSPYLQVVQQVRHALRLGLLREGDQLPTVKEVVARLAINPNTVLKAYRELEREGLVEGKRGQGTFVRKSLATSQTASDSPLRLELSAWMDRAIEGGLGADDVDALFQDARNEKFPHTAESPGQG